MEIKASEASAPRNTPKAIWMTSFNVVPGYSRPRLDNLNDRKSPRDRRGGPLQDKLLHDLVMMMPSPRIREQSGGRRRHQIVNAL